MPYQNSTLPKTQSWNYPRPCRLTSAFPSLHPPDPSHYLIPNFSTCHPIPDPTRSTLDPFPDLTRTEPYPTHFLARPLFLLDLTFESILADHFLGQTLPNVAHFVPDPTLTPSSPFSTPYYHAHTAFPITHN